MSFFIPGLTGVAVRYPVISFLFLATLLSWGPWLLLPPFANGHWGLIKVMIGCGLGPGLAAVILDYAHGTGGPIGTRAWWSRFAFVAVPVALLCASSVLSGDGLMPEDFANARGRPLDMLAVLVVCVCAAEAGFIYACAAGSRRASLNGIARSPRHRSWWFIALLLPAGFVLVSIPLEPLTGEEIPSWPWADLSGPQAVLYLTRAFLFTLLVTCIGEEPGWRGWMLPSLQRRWSPLSSTIVVGVVWGLWHYPLLVNGAYPDADPEKVLEYAFFGPIIGIAFTWMFNRGGVLGPCLLLHAGINNWPRILPSGAFYPILLSLFLLGVLIADRMWKRRDEERFNAPPDADG